MPERRGCRMVQGAAGMEPEAQKPESGMAVLAAE